MNKKPSSTHVMEKIAFRRIIPPLAFMLALCLLVICCYESGYTGLPPTEKRYVAAKAGIANLKQNDKKNMQREPWEALAEEFRSIYDTDPAWPNRPAALFRAAESLEELAKRSFNKSDARKAINCYETLALRHASSRLADDSLFRAAQMRAAWLRDEKGALALLSRLKAQYPNGDMYKEALALEKALRASGKGQAAPAAVKAAASSSPKDAVEDQPAANSKKTNSTFVGDLPLRYKAAKSRVASLRSDNVKACWRQPWEELREEFLRISNAGKNRLAPSALYQAAFCQQSIASCSRLAADSKKALQLYLDVAKKYPAHALADDAILQAARLQYSLAGGKTRANELLDRIFAEYKKGDMLVEAKRLKSIWSAEAKPEKNLQAAKNPKKGAKEKAELQVLSWDSKSKNNVEITLEMSAPAKFSARLQEAGKGKNASLFVDLDNVDIIGDVRKGVTVQGSLLKAVRVSEIKGGGATLRFDFRDARRFDARSEADPHRIIISVAAGSSPLPKTDKAVRSATVKKAAPAVKAAQVSNMASQLGLTVQRVFIDAGHGGKDPGTSHNKVLERLITLDVAMDLGRLLQANGMEVIYSRTKDRAVKLSERTRMANAANADLFVSIHVNANDNPAVSGIETYYLNLASNPQAARVAVLENASSDRRLGDMHKMLADVMLNARVDESRRLATDIQRLTVYRLKKRNYAPRNNGVKSAPFHVLLGAQMPAVLVEIGYCTNSREAINLADAKYRHALAAGLAEGIMAYRDRLLKNRTAGNFLTDNPTDAM